MNHFLLGKAIFWFILCLRRQSRIKPPGYWDLWEDINFNICILLCTLQCSYYLYIIMCIIISLGVLSICGLRHNSSNVNNSFILLNYFITKLLIIQHCGESDYKLIEILRQKQTRITTIQKMLQSVVKLISIQLYYRIYKHL